MARTGVTRIIACTFIQLCFAVVAEEGKAVNGSGSNIAQIAIDFLKMPEKVENLVISPISIHSVLGVLLHGAGGNSAAEIRAFLGSNLTDVQEEINSVLKDSKGANGEKIFNSTTRIFYRKGIEIEEAFRENAKKDFDTELIEIDFSKSNALNVINDWLNNGTNVTIERNDFSADSDFLVVNAMELEDCWNDKFSSKDSLHGNFYMSPNQSVDFPFMTKYDVELVSGMNEHFGAKWIHLPYKEDRKMLLVLPIERFGLNEMISKLSLKNVLEMIRDKKKENVSISIPRFYVKTQFPVDVGLKKLGVNEIFTGHANLTRIAKFSAPVKVSKIVQSSQIRVDEEKTSVAMKTVGSLDFHSGSLPLLPTANFTADEPFLFFVLAGEISVFAGVVAQPEELIN